MLTPKLRFKQFSLAWKTVNLGSLGTFKKGSSLSKGDISHTGTPCILYGDLYTTYGAVINEVKKVTDTILKKPVIGQRNDMLIPSSGESAIDIACASALNVPDVIIGGDLNLFKPNKGIDGRFLSYQINGVRKNKLSTYAQGASVVHLYSNSLKMLNIVIPELAEQKKIADFLSLLDRRIDKQQEKVEALKEQKKGLLQRIFSQELRFKDDVGNEFPKWEVIILNKIAKKIKTKNDNFTVTNVISNSATRGLISQRSYFDKDIANSKNINGYYVIKKNDFVYNPRVSREAPYGPISLYPFTEKGVVSPLYLCFEVNNINTDFLAYYFKSSHWHQHIYTTGDQGARHDRVSIKDNEFFKIKVPYPSKLEQQKISDFLILFDKKLEREKEKLEYLYSQKKGFMQQMFV